MVHVCAGGAAHTCSATVVLQFDSRSSPSPAAQRGNVVLYLVPLLQGTEVIFIKFRSLSVDSLGTTHIVWDMYTRPTRAATELESNLQDSSGS